MTAYCEAADVKTLLQIEAEDTTYDTELAACITTADALIASLLEPHDLTVPTVVPQNIADASAHYAAWLFRKRRDPTGADAFKLEADTILQAYIESSAEVAFKVVSDQ